MPTAKQHAQQARHYFENASVRLQEGEAEKAAELLWGSMVQALKAVASRKGKKLHNHYRIREFARELSKELRDESLWDKYVVAEHLHADFYEVNLTREDVAAMAEGVKSTVERLIGLSEEPLPVTR